MADIIPITKKLKKRKKNGKIINIASGKGGVGKSVISCNLSYQISKRGLKCLLVDGSYGLGNIDILEGYTPKHNISHVKKGIKSIDEIIKKDGLRHMIPAAIGITELTTLHRDLNNLILKTSQNYDITIIDSPTGIGQPTLEFIRNADYNIIITNNEPASITNNYALMKVLFLNDITNEFDLIVNNIGNASLGNEVYRQIDLVVNKYLDIKLNYLGHLSNDENLKKSVSRQQLISRWKPESEFCKDLERIVRRLI